MRSRRRHRSPPSQPVTSAPAPGPGAYGLVDGTPDLKTAGALSFGPEGILFVGDSLGASVFAIDVGTGAPVSTAARITVANIDQKIGALLGATADQVVINDMAVQRASQDVYFSVTRGRGAGSQPALVRLRGGQSRERSARLCAVLENQPG